jgi:predicted transcriptional regulator
MKAVMISIRPGWCEKIASGEKTVEVRKTRPKLEPPFRCYIYATKPKRYYKVGEHLAATDENLYLSGGKVKMSDGFEFWADGTRYEYLSGKVIGEFVCDGIFPIRVFENGSIQDYLFHNMEKSCVPYDDIAQYIGYDKIGYGWRISDLVIYDAPMDLSEFKKWVDRSHGQRYHEDMLYLQRPPQSWCYIVPQPKQI